MIKIENFSSAIILAGGKSSRMGFDKQRLIINENILILDLAKKLENHFDEIIIVTNKKDYYKNTKYKILTDEIKGAGPLAGISVGLKNSKGLYSYIIACDMPVIDDNYIRYLKQKISNDIKYKKESEIYITLLNNKVQLFHGFYKNELCFDINSYLLNDKSKSIKGFYENSNKKVDYTLENEFDIYNLNKSIFINLNTKQDLNLYEKEFKNYGCY